jgi:hypoxanthine phosphoribosyltransferase
MYPSGLSGWALAEAGFADLVRQVNEDDYEFDTLVGIGIGGRFGVAFCGDKFKTRPDLHYVQCEFFHYGQRRQTVLLTNRIRVARQPKKLLFIMGVVHTGRTLDVCTRQFEDLGVEEIRSATIFQGLTPQCRANYVHERGPLSLAKLRRIPWYPAEIKWLDPMDLAA